jgi:hypothetical protein
MLVRTSQKALAIGGKVRAPVVYWDFANYGLLPAWASFTRTGTATYFDSTGTLQTAATGIPRFDHTMAGIPLGLIIEEARTNIIKYNRDLTQSGDGTIWVCTNITPVLDQNGIDGVASSASSLLATGTGPWTALQTVTQVSNTVWTTAYVKRLIGSGAVKMTTDGGSSWTTVTVTTSWTRVSIPKQTLANPSVGFQLNLTGDQIAVDYVQNETYTSTSGYTSPIATTSVSGTRNIEACTLSGNAFAFIMASTGAIIVETNPPNATDYGLTSGYILEGNVGGQTIMMTYDNTHFATHFGAYLVSGAFTGGYSAVTVRSGITWSTSGRSVGANGGVVVSDTGAFASSFGIIYIGGKNTKLNGRISKIAIYNRRLTNTELAVNTTVGAPL